MRTIGVVSVARSDFSIYLPVLKQVCQTPDLKLQLYVTGAHLSSRHGMTVQEIERAGFNQFRTVPIGEYGDCAKDISLAIAATVKAFSDVYSQSKPEVLLVLGDRYEMFAAALAALPFEIPIAHIHGGELTQGAFDDSLRHALTKLSHLHFVSTDEYKKRVEQLGEESWRVIVSGAPALENLKDIKLLVSDELWHRLNHKFASTPLLCTFHPVTHELERIDFQIVELLTALETIKCPVLFTAPNADTYSSKVRSKILEYVKHRPDCLFVDNLGGELYFSALNSVAAMVGNSSSGIIEAASFNLPVVNIGTRQKGRVRGKNVIDVADDRLAIVDGLRRALSVQFRQQLSGLVNPYYREDSAAVIVNQLKKLEINNQLFVKAFIDL